MLIDAASLYYRAFHGVPDRRRDPAAPPTNAVRGLVDMTASLVAHRSPGGLVMCWDDDWRPAFRVEAIPSYKEHRLAPGDTTGTTEDTPPDLVPQVPVIVDLLAALGIARVGAPGYEADDVIGTLVERTAGRRPVEVVTGDRDLFQLVDDAAGVRVLYTARGGVRDADEVDESWLVQKYGLASGRAYAEMAVLRGDPSDGLPGVKGIGEKTAVQLLDTFGSLAGITEALDRGDDRLKGARRARLEEGRDYLAAAPRVVDVARDAPLEVTDEALALPREVADPAALADLVERYDLGGPVGRLLDALGLPPLA
ncbi:MULTISPECIES: 5'-3' exonuclease [Kytococcus]|uniref:5'-3' exonuclease n=1 Tax=Kytococcus TaxID=57499 RepID=UPI0008A1AF5F|nr:MULTISPECIES: 5'-3' exonuclease [Kytococcus]OFS15572.1 5'-3' exonuclease [Kytococcus sp. HMSC28H12]